MKSNKLTWALVAFLTLLLTACGGSSNKTAQTPEVDPKITAARTAAAAAETAAETAKNNADTSAKEAEDAVMGIIAMQTGTLAAKTHAEAARAAATAAMTAYNTAKDESDKADAATTVEAAEAAKTAAETAKGTAETQAKTAADKAKEAMDAAMMELKYKDDAYSVGTMSINPTAIGKEKTTVTEDGKTMETGWIEAITFNSKLIGTGDAFTEGQTVATAANNPSVEAGAVEVMIGNKYDSADDKARLQLITHYISKTKKIGLHGGDLDESRSGAGTHTVELESTNAAPYGMYKGERVYKASYIDFHVLHSGRKVPHTSAFQAENLISYWVENLAPETDAPNKVGKPTKAGNVFYYGTTVEDGIRDALRLTGIKTETDGTVKYVYRLIRAYEGPAAPLLEEAKAYKHINYGIWSNLSPSGYKSADLGIGFVRMLADGARTGSDTPSGTATYNGHYVANVRDAGPASSADVTERHGESTVTADFGKSTVTVDLDGLADLEGTISDDSFSGTKITNIEAPTGSGLTASTDNGVKANGEGTPVYTGNFSGAFFGAKAAEVGGIFHYDGKDKGAFTGAFGGAKQTPAAE